MYESSSRGRLACCGKGKVGYFIVEGLGLWIISSSELRGTVISLLFNDSKKTLKKRLLLAAIFLGLKFEDKKGQYELHIEISMCYFDVVLNLR